MPGVYHDCPVNSVSCQATDHYAFPSDSLCLHCTHSSPEVGNRPVSLPQGCYLYGRCPSQKDVCAAMPQELRTMPDGREIRCWRVTEGDFSDVQD